MRRYLMIAVALVATVILAPAAALAAEEKPAGTSASPTTGVMYSSLVTATAKVEAIDLAKRLVTVRGPKGNVVEIECGPEVRNLPQVKVGDMVVVKYQESIAFDLKKEGGEPQTAAAGLVARADEGEKPAAGGARVIVADVTIQAIDTKTMMVTVKGPKGNVYDVKARDPKRLETLKVGDQVRVTYTEALAVSVEEAAH
jgi:hypothetical protein